MLQIRHKTIHSHITANAVYSQVLILWLTEIPTRNYTSQKKAQDYGQGNVTFLGFGLTLGLDRAFPEGIFMGVGIFAQFLSIGTMMTYKVSYRAYNNCY